MIKYTNNKRISVPLAVWCLMDNYNTDERDNVISVTTLLKPIQQIYYGRKYKDAIKEMDASDLISSSMGTALHDSVEKTWKFKDKVIKILDGLGFANSEAIYNEVVLERRSEQEVIIDGKPYIISGQFDIAFMGTVCDIKSTSVWSYIYGSKDEDYILQMSIYRWLNQDIIKDDYGYIEHIFTDWSATKALQDSQYPQNRILTKKLKLLSIEDTEKYIIEKLTKLKTYEDLNDDLKVLKCTDEELWREKDVYKVYMPNKTTGKINYSRATKNFEDKKLAYDFAGSNGVVKEQQGGVKRCMYCNYTNLCNQYTDLLIKGDIKQ